MTTATLDLQTASPVEIDTALASLYRAETHLMYEVSKQAEYLREKAGIRLADDPVSRYDREPKTVGTTADALAALKAIAAEGGGTYSKAFYAQQRIEAYESAVEALRANRDEQKPLDAEYVRRGRWTRSFMVLNNNGHAHRDMHCSTCYPTTRYGWLTDLSGKTEAEVIEALGSDACSTCYADAPVVKRARTAFALEEKEAQRAREQRAAEKAEREAKRAAKALGVTVKGPHGKIETLAAAKQTLTDAFAWLDHPYYADGTLIDALVAAISAKTGESPDEIRTVAAKRAAKRK